MMERIRVYYNGGESRQHPGKAVDYMLVEIEDVELYAEAVNPTWDEASESYTDETATYEDLRVEIMRQAVERGIDVTTLEFAYDSDEAGTLLAVRQAADIMGISDIRVRQLCQDGRMGRKVGDTWVITPGDIQRNRVRLPAGRPAVAYERIGSWGGYKVRKAPTGFVVEHWSAHTDELTDDKYLLPYGKAAGGYGKDADLSADHNDLMTIGDFLYHEAPFEGRVLRKGRIVQ